MRLVNFEEGVVPLVADMNALSTNAEDSFDALIRAISTSTTGNVLFKNIAPTAAVAADVLTVTVTSQEFAVAGSVQTAPAAINQFDVSLTDKQVRVFLVASRQDDTQTREFNSVLSSGAVVQQQLDTPIYKDEVARVEFTSSDSLTTTPDDPVLLANDLGFIELGSVAYNSTTFAITVTENSTDGFVLPSGAVGGVTEHAATHLPGGSDEIQVASVGTSSSTVGLMPEGALFTALNSIQSLVSASTASYINIADLGDNNLSLDVTLFDSMTIEDNNGSPALGVNFQSKSAINGFEDKAARSDHRHLALEAGVLTEVFTIDVTTAALGAVFNFTVSPQTINGKTITPTKIVSSQALWVPPNSINGQGIEAGWNVLWEAGANRTVGARTFVEGADSFVVEVGEVGATFLSPAANTYVDSISSAPFVQGQFPTTGTLQITVTATSDQ